MDAKLAELAINNKNSQILPPPISTQINAESGDDLVMKKTKNKLKNKKLIRD